MFFNVNPYSSLGGTGGSFPRRMMLAFGDGLFCLRVRSLNHLMKFCTDAILFFSYSDVNLEI
jgi:hypothetical protein